jgi:ATP-dependent Zn protease
MTTTDEIDSNSSSSIDTISINTTIKNTTNITETTPTTTTTISMNEQQLFIVTQTNIQQISHDDDKDIDYYDNGSSIIDKNNNNNTNNNNDNISTLILILILLIMILILILIHFMMKYIHLMLTL